MTAASTNKTEFAPAKKEFEGVVVSDRMKNTVVVNITRFIKHPRYKKYVASGKRLKAHAKDGQCKVGDRVTIRETRPYSKDKHFVVVQPEEKTSTGTPKEEKNN